MKQKFILSMLASALGVLPAIAGDPAPAPSRVIVNAGNIEHVHVLSSMQVILLQAPQDEKAIVFGDQALQKLDLRISNKTLSISGKGTAKGNTVVYLYVSNLKSISVEGNTDVKTVGSLASPKLDVFVDGYAKVHIRSMGTVKAHSMNDSELDVKYLQKMPAAF